MSETAARIRSENFPKFHYKKMVLEFYFSKNVDPQKIAFIIPSSVLVKDNFLSFFTLEV